MEMEPVRSEKWASAGVSGLAVKSARLK